MTNIHIGLHVTDLDASIDFYTNLFNTKPVKVKEDYAKYLPDHLQLNFTLNRVAQIHGNQVGHFGIQVESKSELMKQKERVEKLGFFSRDEIDTTCCYALQDKFWITDPDGNEWEFFFTKDDQYDNQCCSIEGGNKDEYRTV